MVRRLGSSPTPPRPRPRAAAGTRIGRRKMKIRRVNFSPDEFLAGTVRLSAVERGCYWTVCCLIYSHGGPVDDDPEWLAKACNCHGNTWLAVRRRLVDLGKLFALPPTGAQPCGRLMNRRAAQELNAAHSRVKLARKAGETSAKTQRKARQKTRELLKSNGLGRGSVQRPRSTIKSHESLTTDSSLNQNPTGSARAHRPASEGQPARAPDDARKVGDVARGIVRNRLRRKP